MTAFEQNNHLLHIIGVSGFCCLHGSVRVLDPLFRQASWWCFFAGAPGIPGSFSSLVAVFPGLNFAFLWRALEERTEYFDSGTTFCDLHFANFEANMNFMHSLLGGAKLLLYILPFCLYSFLGRILMNFCSAEPGLNVFKLPVYSNAFTGSIHEIAPVLNYHSLRRVFSNYSFIVHVFWDPVTTTCSQRRPFDDRRISFVPVRTRMVQRKINDNYYWTRKHCGAIVEGSINGISWFRSVYR